MPPPLLPKSLLLKGAIRKGEEQEAFQKSAAVAPSGPGLLKGSVHILSVLGSGGTSSSIGATWLGSTGVSAEGNMPPPCLQLAGMSAGIRVPTG